MSDIVVYCIVLYCDMCVCLFVCLFVCLLVYLFLCLPVCLLGRQSFNEFKRHTLTVHIIILMQSQEIEYKRRLVYNILHMKDFDVTVQLVPSPPGPVASPRLCLVRLVSRTYLNILKTENKTEMKSRRTTIECSKEVFQDSQNNVAVHATCLYVNIAEQFPVFYWHALFLNRCRKASKDRTVSNP